MLIAQRQEDIIRRIKEEGNVKVETLAREYDVSLMTIRRDLEYLHSIGRIERCHGGAIAKQEVPFEEKIWLNAEDKEKIAERALDFIRDGDCVFLDAGTTNLCLAKKLGRFKEMTVITNDLEIGYYLNRCPVSLIMTGGEVQEVTSCMLGEYANKLLAGLKMDVAFIGAATIDEDFEVLTPTEHKVVYKRLVVKNASRSYLLVDKTKFNKKAMRKVNLLSDYTGIITTYRLTEEEEKSKRYPINFIYV